MKRCKMCRKKPRLERRMNNEGVVFCSDDCYEEFDGSYNDMDHPYIDDYDAIRSEWIEWMKNYENDLQRNLKELGNPKKQDLIDSIDIVLQDFLEYYALAGSDGIFSLEIYNYLIGLEELREVIAKWNDQSLSSM